MNNKHYPAQDANIFIGCLISLGAALSVITGYVSIAKLSTGFPILLIFIFGIYLIHQGISVSFSSKSKVPAKKIWLMLVSYESFIENILTKKQPPLFFLSVFLIGAAMVTYNVDSASYLYDGLYSNWFQVIASSLILGFFWGLGTYYVIGFFYDIAIKLGRGKRDIFFSRNLFLYSWLPMAIIVILSKLLQAYIYGNGYFTLSISQNEKILFVLIAFVFGLLGIALTYRGVRHVQKLKLLPALILFVLIPFGFLIQSSAPYLSDAFDSTSVAYDYNAQAELSFNEGDYEDAEDLYEKAISHLIGTKANDELITVHLNLAKIKYVQGDVEGMKIEYDSALTLLTESDALFHSITGKLSVLGGDLEAAIRSFDKAIEIDQSDFMANNILSLIYLDSQDSKINNPLKALTYSEVAYRINPNDIGAMQNLAVNYFLLERYNDALTIFESLAKLQPENNAVQSFLNKTRESI